MSQDNVYLIRELEDGSFVLQMAFDSDELLPVITDDEPRYSSVAEAVAQYNRLEDDNTSGYPLSEYGIRVITRRAPWS